jgi:GNAT superfamily N-acetyltransferase
MGREMKLGKAFIRRLEVRDVMEALYVINKSNAEAYRKIIPPEYFKEPVFTYEEFLKKFNEMVFYGYELEGKIVGVAALQLLNEYSGNTRFVYVLPEHQRKGIGTSLATYIEAEARRFGLKYLTVPYVDKKLFDLEVASKRVLRLTRAQAMVRSILSRDEYANVFFLHHTLDLLAPRLIAANITNTPIERCADNVCETVCMELELVSRKAPYKLSNFSQAFKSMFNRVISHPSLASWVNEASDRRLTLERSVNIQDYLTHYA